MQSNGGTGCWTCGEGTDATAAHGLREAVLDGSCVNCCVDWADVAKLAERVLQLVKNQNAVCELIYRQQRAMYADLLHSTGGDH